MSDIELIIWFVSTTALVAMAILIVRELVSRRPTAAVVPVPVSPGEQPAARKEVPPAGPYAFRNQQELLVMFWSLLCGGAFFAWYDTELAALCGAALGALGTIAFVMYQRAKWLSSVHEQVPQVLDLLARSVRSGQSVPQAIECVSETIREPLRAEFNRCADRLKMGLSLEGAFQQMCKRVPVNELRILASTLTLHTRTGGNLAVMLDHLARAMRDRLTFQRQARANNAMARLSSTLSAVAAPAITAYMFIYMQDYTQTLWQSSAGHYLLALSALLQAVGLYLIANMMSTEY